MRVHVIDIGGTQPPVGQGEPRSAGRLPTVGQRLDHVMRVACGGIAAQLGIGHRTAPRRRLRLFQDEESRTLAHHEPVAIRVEGPRRHLRRVVVAGAQRADDVEGPKGQGAERDLHAARQRSIRAAAADPMEGLAQRHGPRRAGIGGREDGPVQPQGDAQVGWRRAAEDGQRKIGGDALDAALHVALVLHLRVGDAAQRGSDVHPDPVGTRRATFTHRQAGVDHGQLPGGQGELAEAVELPGRPGVHVVERVEVVHLGGDLGAEPGGVESIDAPDRRPTCLESEPERLQPDADRRDQAEPRDPDPARRVPHTEGFARGVGMDGSSASCLKVASVRPAMGRVKKRSTKAGSRRLPMSGIPRWNSCSMVTSEPPSRARMCQVTSMLLVTPRTWRKRRRRSAGSEASAHCSVRQVTGKGRGPKARTATI